MTKFSHHSAVNASYFNCNVTPNANIKSKSNLHVYSNPENPAEIFAVAGFGQICKKKWLDTRFSTAGAEIQCIPSDNGETGVETANYTAL